MGFPCTTSISNVENDYILLYQIFILSNIYFIICGEEKMSFRSVTMSKLW